MNPCSTLVRERKPMILAEERNLKKAIDKETSPRPLSVFPLSPFPAAPCHAQKLTWRWDCERTLLPWKKKKRRSHSFASLLHLCSFWHFSSAFHVRTKIPSPVVIRVGRSRYKLQKLNAQFWEKIMWWWQTKTPKLQLCKYCSSHDLCVQGKKERKAMWEAQKSKEEYLDIFRTTRGNQFFRTYRFFFSFLSLSPCQSVIG